MKNCKGFKRRFVFRPVFYIVGYSGGEVIVKLMLVLHMLRDTSVEGGRVGIGEGVGHIVYELSESVPEYYAVFPSFPAESVEHFQYLVFCDGIVVTVKDTVSFF